jgi:hypothetical protein
MQAVKENRAERQTREGGAFTKRIGSTVYRVNVHFSKTSKETANDKIARLVRGGVAGKAVTL